jgi:hypothetical protein
VLLHRLFTRVGLLPPGVNPIAENNNNNNNNNNNRTQKLFVALPGDT